MCQPVQSVQQSVLSVGAIKQCQGNQSVQQSSVHALTDDALGCNWLAGWPARCSPAGWLLGDSDELAGYAVRWLPVNDSLAMWLAGGLTTRRADWLARWLVARSETFQPTK